jgi:hypothetical protein
VRALTLDYGRRRTPAVALARVALLGGGVALLAATAAAYVGRAQELSAIHEQAQELRRMSQRGGTALRSRPGDTQEIEAEVRRANAVLEQINLPWLELLDVIQSTRGEAVALLSVQPDARQHTVRIGAEAKSLADALDYVRRLTAHPRFKGVYLVNHEIIQQDPQKPVRVQLLANWSAS